MLHQEGVGIGVLDRGTPRAPLASRARHTPRRAPFFVYQPCVIMRSSLALLPHQPLRRCRSTACKLAAHAHGQTGSAAHSHRAHAAAAGQGWKSVEHPGWIKIDHPKVCGAGHAGACHLHVPVCSDNERIGALAGGSVLGHSPSAFEGVVCVRVGEWPLAGHRLLQSWTHARCVWSSPPRPHAECFCGAIGAVGDEYMALVVATFLELAWGLCLHPPPHTHTPPPAHLMCKSTCMRAHKQACTPVAHAVL